MDQICGETARAKRDIAEVGGRKSYGVQAPPSSIRSIRMALTEALVVPHLLLENTGTVLISSCIYTQPHPMTNLREAIAVQRTFGR